MSNAINKSEISVLLGIGIAQTTCLIEKSAGFPGCISKQGTKGKRGREHLFDRNEVLAWAAPYQKGFCTIMAQQAVRGKLWIINKQAGHG